MSGSPIYCSHSWLPSHHLILVSWGHISQKYSLLYSGLFCRENDFKKKRFIDAFYPPSAPFSYELLFPLFMLLLSSHVADRPVSACNLSCAACIFFPQGSYFYFYPLLLSCIVLPPITSLFSAGLALLYICSYTHRTCMIAGLSSSNVPSASDWILINMFFPSCCL